MLFCKDKLLDNIDWHKFYDIISKMKIKKVYYV